MTTRFARARVAPAAIAVGVALSCPGVAAAATRIGPDLATAPPPTASCGAPACTATQLAGAVGAAAPVDGQLVRFRLRHGPAGALGETVRLLVLEGDGQQLTVARASGPQTVAGTAADGVSTFAVELPIRAGQRIGLQVESTFVQPEGWLRVTGAAPGAAVGQHVGVHPAGATAAYAEAPDRLLLLNADLEPAAAGGGGGTGGGGTGGGGTGGGGTGGGGGGGGTGGTGGGGAGGGTGGGGTGGTGNTGGGSTGAGAPVCRAGAAAARAAAPVRTAAVEALPAPSHAALALSPAPAAAASAWRTRRLDASDSYNEVAAAFDRRGGLHVAARGGFRHRVVYAGPRGRRLVEATNDQGSVAIAAPRSGPAIAYGMDHADDVGGRLVFCDVLKLARGPAFRPAAVRVQRTGETGYFFADLAADPRRDTLHALYELGRRAPQLHHWQVGGAATRLPLVGGTLRGARIATRGGTVAVVARTDGALQLLVRRGGGRWQRTVLARRAGGPFALAIAPDGRPRVAFADALGRLRLSDGRRVVATGAPVASVGLAVDGRGRLHVALAPTARACHTTNVWTCRRGGIHHLRVAASLRRVAVSTVQPTTGDAPGRLAVAVHGGAVAIAYGDPARSRQLTVKRRG